MGHRLFGAPADQIRALCQPEHIEDQRYFPVAHNGGSRVGVDTFQLLAKGFNDDFLGIVDLIDN